MNYIIRYIFLFFFTINTYTPIFAEYLFLSSVPLGAKVSILVPKNNAKGFKTEYIGTTPLKYTNFSKSTTITIEHQGYFSLTNEIPSSTKIQNFAYTLTPLSFDFAIYNQPNAVFTVNKKTYNSLDGILSLPYGYYYFSPNKTGGYLDIAYQSPYAPYIGFFSTVTVLSTILAITGGVLAHLYFQEYQQYTNKEDLISGIKKVTTWDTVTWSSVGIGTGALIGTIISSTLEAKAQKRIKRFNGLNKSTKEMDYLSDFEEVVYLASLNHPNAIKKIDTFIKLYPDSFLLSDIYLKRAGLYLLADKPQFNKAISDLNVIITKYPTKDNYEFAHKMLGDIYLELKNYRKAYEAYKETIKVLNIIPLSSIKMSFLTSLYYQVKGNNQYKEEFLQESKNMKNLSLEDQEQIEIWRSEII